jgi:molecular chaperone GrpE
MSDKNTFEETIVEENIVEDTTQDETNVEVEVELTNEELLQNQINDAKDVELRLRAEFDNYKRRTTNDILNASNRGKNEVITAMLETLDNLERAMMHECSDESYRAGIVLVYNKLIEKLNSFGLEVINCEGIMDHNFHQAVVTDSVDDLDEDQIIEVLQKGYKVQDDVIRHAMVKVNKK